MRSAPGNTLVAGGSMEHAHGSAAPNDVAGRRRRSRRAFWLKQIYSWHWISSAICLAGILLFAVTGITLNHAADIDAEPVVTEIKALLPDELLQQLRTLPKTDDAPVPDRLAAWLSEKLGIAAAGRPAEWSEEEVYLALPRPGGDAWVSLDLASGAVLYEATDRGWISYLNDLHKGRNTGPVWGWFIDIFAAACLVFSATGLILLQTHSARRPATWPMVAIGLCVPFLLAMLFIH